MLRAMLVGRGEAEVDAEPGLYVLAHQDHLLQVVTNLVANAMQHAGEGTHIGLTARRDRGAARIEISDTAAQRAGHRG